MPGFDQLVSALQRPDVPRDERIDLNAEVLNQFIKSLEFPDREEVESYLPTLSKASTLEPFFEQYVIGNRRTPTHTAILYLNEYGIVDRGDGTSRYLEKPSIGGFRFLKDVVTNTDIIQAIIRTRVRQIVSFCQPVRDQSPLGFRFERVDGEKVTDADKPALRALEQFLLNSGDEPDPVKRDRLRRSSFKQFITKLVWDSLSADACPIEMVSTNNGKLSGYHNLDYETIRLTIEAGYEGDDEIRAVQLGDGIPAVAFTYDDILYPVRTPRTDLRAGGYGYAEPEGIIRAITGYINILTYNLAGLDRSSVPRGILNVFGEYDQPQLNTFKRSLVAMVSGAGNRHNFPIMVSKSKEGGALWTKIDDFNEMLFARMVTLVVSIACAHYGTHPEEVNFDSFSTRTSSLGGKADTEEKLSHSHDKGLIPFVGDIEDTINAIVRRRTTQYRFAFVGVHQEDEDKKHERIKLSSTIDELREMDGKDPLDNPLLGKAPSNPALMQVYMTEVQQQMQPQPGVDGQAQDQSGSGGTDDYPQDALGAHNPYGQDPDGGAPTAPPQDEHLHTLDFGKARPPARRVGDFMVVVEHGVTP